MSRKTLSLKCPTCGTLRECINRSAICLKCGGVAVQLELDGAFEEAAEGDEVKVPKKQTKKVADTTSRPAESGGRVF